MALRAWRFAACAATSRHDQVREEPNDAACVAGRVDTVGQRKIFPFPWNPRQRPPCHQSPPYRSSQHCSAAIRLRKWVQGSRCITTTPCVCRASALYAARVFSTAAMINVHTRCPYCSPQPVFCAQDVLTRAATRPPGRTPAPHTGGGEPAGAAGAGAARRALLRKDSYHARQTRQST